MELDELMKPLNITPDLPRREKSGWCDEILNQLASQDLYKELTLPELRPIYSFFISAYFATDTFVIEEVAEFIPILILHMKIGDKKIGQKFLSTNGKTKKLLEDAETIFQVDDSAMLACSRAVLSKPIKGTNVTYCNCNCNASQKAKKARQIIKEYEDLGQVLGFCCLVLLRFITKSEKHVMNYFSRKAGEEFRRIFPSNKFRSKLTPPNRCMLNMLGNVLEFKKGSKRPLAENIFSKVVSLYVDAVSMKSVESYKVVDVLMSGLLHSTEFNGVGLISLYESFKRQYSLDDKTASRYLCRLNMPFEKVSKSFDRISKFCETYANKDHPEYSWRWARIIDDSYFTDYNVKANIILCSHLAAIIESKNPSVWNMTELKNLSHEERRKLSKWAAQARKCIEGADKNESHNYKLDEDKPKESAKVKTGTEKKEISEEEMDEDEPKGIPKMKRRVEKNRIKGKKTGEKTKGRTTFSKKFDTLEDFYDCT